MCNPTLTSTRPAPGPAWPGRPRPSSAGPRPGNTTKLNKIKTSSQHSHSTRSHLFIASSNQIKQINQTIAVNRAPRPKWLDWSPGEVFLLASLRYEPCAYVLAFRVVIVPCCNLRICIDTQIVCGCIHIFTTCKLQREHSFIAY